MNSSLPRTAPAPTEACEPAAAPPESQPAPSSLVDAIAAFSRGGEILTQLALGQVSLPVRSRARAELKLLATRAVARLDARVSQALGKFVEHIDEMPPSSGRTKH
jgi:hypothetical protein